MKMVCVKCGTELRPLKNDVTVITQAAPREIWMADLWECASCGTNIVAGFAPEPLAVEYDPEFAEILRKIEAGNETIIYSHGREAREEGTQPRLIDIVHQSGV